MPKEKKTSVSSKPERLVLDYMSKQNRPYSVTDIVSNLHAAVTKTECQRAVNSLVEKELLTSKTFGKQTIYVVRQDTIETVNPDELASIDKRLAQLRENIAEQKSRQKQLSTELASLNSALTTEEIEHRLIVLTSKNEQSKEHLLLLQSGSQLVPVEERQRVTREMETHRKLWAQRRRLFKDMFSTVTENLPGKPKELLEELDISLDDPIDININPRDLLST
ncbi:PSMC3 interacting protein [Linnemannia schmuckeri]|uniref:Homologous-pairing protein 2 homolog n=1 Tax=Linnemannia schmuckeri TaxID=64567 RepID=A0A9P5VDQ3_9FUNG|nr:PSMC3 interacting protein [Linnemannia schmuckeri]